MADGLLPKSGAMPPSEVQGKAGLAGGGAIGSLLQKQGAGRPRERLSLPPQGSCPPVQTVGPYPPLPWVLQLSPDPSQGWRVSLPPGSR